jgi:exonuclease SbcD
MRIAHTSDWHLGRSFGDVSLATDQEAFADWFVEFVKTESCDLVVIAGDVYDRAIAPTESIDLFRDTVRRLLGTGATLAVITGNHDAASRVAAYSDLLDLSGLHLRGGYDRVGEVIHAEFDDGPLDLVLLPFLHPQAAPDDFGELAGSAQGAAGASSSDGEDLASEFLARRRRQTHESVLASAIAAARPAMSAPRSLAIAHAYVIGGHVSDSERLLEVGGTGQVNGALFEGFSYTALGHLHRPQDVGGSTIRYSGTPIAYSFSEEHQKSVSLIEMATDGACTVSEVPVQVGRAVTTLTGPIEELLQPDRHIEAQQKFVRAIITDPGTVLDAKHRMREVYPYVVEIKLQPAGLSDAPEDAPPDIRDMKPLDAICLFWDEAEGSVPAANTEELLSEVLAGVLERSELQVQA